MAIYAVGDLQGCFKPLTKLLDIVAFNPSKDHLYLVGDVIARGPDSLDCLAFLYKHQDAITITLGNHDLHFLACTTLNKSPNPKDKLDAIFNSTQLSKYTEFLKRQPLAICLPEHNAFISHAGIHPSWTIEQALEYASFVQHCYRSQEAADYYTKMYQAHPEGPINQLSSHDKFTAIVNVFTRMRYLTRDGQLNLINKSGDSGSSSLTAWFKFERFENTSTSFIFGHWAALKGVTNRHNIIALDTGCVWGGPMTMMNIATKEHFLSK